MANDDGGVWQADDHHDDDDSYDHEDDDEDSQFEDDDYPHEACDDDSYDSNYPHEAYDDDGYNSNYGLMLEYELLRIHPEIWPTLEACLRGQPNFVVAWLQAICASFPERKLIDVVREGDPRLFPPCLCTKEAKEDMPGYLVLIDNDIVSVRDDRPRKEKKSRKASRLAELEAFKACRFQQGFASEGMLCDEPPIPLRVLDFLETQDLVNLSLVCKSAHQAAHLLFQREEAVAASSFPDIFEEIDCQADLLRDIRLASLMHGTPEAIPAGPVVDSFIRQSPAEPASPRSVTWLFQGTTLWFLDDDLDSILDAAIYRRPGVFSARRYRSLHNMCVLEEPQLQALQAQLVQLQIEYSELLLKAEENDRELMRNLLSVVNDALAMREPILLRAYQVDAP